jgi:hypothetical protein
LEHFCHSEASESACFVKKINVDFAKAANNVWLHKTSGSMPLKGINDKLKAP